MFINFNVQDPNVNDALKKEIQGANTVVVNFAHMKPTKVIKNTAKQYAAKYSDSHGSYVFKIQRTGNTFTVISDGKHVMSGASRDRLVWEFENQINSNPIKCVKS